jgi:cob(I)alamin adenosyltransferase
MKIYTRTGDQGETALFGGERVSKDSARIEAYGDVDEVNAAVGVARAFLHDPDLDTILATVQNNLFVLGGDLATPLPPANGQVAYRIPRITADHVTAVEQFIDRADAELLPLHTFILPTGDQGAALLHLARTICRRAERRVVALTRHEQINPQAIVYLNRLSDLLFVIARLANHRAGVTETPWHGLGPGDMETRGRGDAGTG